MALSLPKRTLLATLFALLATVVTAVGIAAILRLESIAAPPDPVRSATVVIGGLVAVSLVLGGLLTWTLLRRHAGERRLGDFYRALIQTSQLIVRESDEGRLFDGLCRICVDYGHMRLAVVSIVQGALATRVAQVGPAIEFFAAHPSQFDPNDAVTRRSATATALREGVHAFSQDYQHEAPAPAWRERAARFGIGALGAFPLRRGGRVVGALVLYAGAPNFFDEPLINLLDEMAGNVSFALDNIDRDIARENAQRQTLASSQRFQQVFQAAPVSTVIAVLDGGEVLEVNDVFCARYGITRDQIVGQPMSALGIGLIPEDDEMYKNRALSEGRMRNVELRIRLMTGEVLTVLANSETLDYEGRRCLLTMSMDVTELRRSEQAREAQAAADSANRAKTAFLSRMSHELRTPLNAMLGFAQLMRRDLHERLTPQELTWLDHIHQAGWHLVSLVNDVLDISRIESGSFEVHARALALAPLLDEALQIGEPLARQCGVTLGVAYRNVPVGLVQVDPVRLRQVLINLLTNAIKYNRPGGTVHIQVNPAGGHVLVELVDTGMGMTAEQLEHLYEPFNRLGRERGGIEGTGLGLALARQLARQMGGELEIQSQLGRGTTARLTLLAADASEEATASVGSQTPAAGICSPSGVILYVEDNEINVILVEQMLSRWSDIHFVHASDGKSGIEQARRLHPDLVLLDMQLPDMRGDEFLERLAADEVTRQLRVVALSASAMPEDVELARNRGALDYWTKPLELERFLSDVAHILATGPGAVSGTRAGHA